MEEPTVRPVSISACVFDGALAVVVFAGALQCLLEALGVYTDPAIVLSPTSERISSGIDTLIFGAALAYLVYQLIHDVRKYRAQKAAKTMAPAIGGK